MATTTAEAHKRAREYETIYILRPDVDPDGADKVAGRVAEVVARENGKLVKVETWGRRKLAYVVAKQRRGVYYYLKYLGGGARRAASSSATCACSDTVMKFQTVLLRDDVEVETVAVDPEEVKFEPHRAHARGREGRVARARARPHRGAGRAAARSCAESEFGDEVPEELDERRVDGAEEAAAKLKPPPSEAAAKEADCRRGHRAAAAPAKAASRRGEVVMSQRNIDFGDDKDFGRTPDLNADAPGRRRGARKRVCRFCADKAVIIDYKDPQALKYFI